MRVPADVISEVLFAEKETVGMADMSRVVVPGPLGPFAAGFVDDLWRQGFRPVTVGKHVALLAGLSSWLAAEGVAASGLSSEVAERFCAARRAAGHRTRVTIKALDPLLGYLRGLGVVPPASRPAYAGPVEELLSSFRRYLEQERGLVPAAARGYVEKVRPFVARFEGPDGLELGHVNVAEVRAFVVEVCPRLGRRAAQLTVVALRSLLRFLHHRVSPGGVTYVVEAAALRAGLACGTAASEMLRAGATLPEVGRCSVTATREAPRSMRRSTGRRSRRSRVHGRERSDERAT